MPNKDVMKIMGAKTLLAIPMEMLLPHEKQALSNHGQSLHRLNERGGLCPVEALGIIEGRSWGELRGRSESADEALLIKLVELFNASEAANAG